MKFNLANKMIKIYKLSDGTNIKVHLQKKGEASSWFCGNGFHDVYRIIMDFGYGVFTTTFHNSIMNYGKPINENVIDDAVDCIISDFFSYKEYPNIIVFMHEFSYDFDNSKEYKKGVSAYNRCCSIYVRLAQLVTADKLMELSNIIRGY